MTNVLTPNAKQQYFDNSGRPANGYRLFTYAAGTTTKLATTVSAAGADNANPIVLNFRGEADIWLPPNVAYKYVFAPPGSDDPPTSPIWTVDGVVSSQLITLYGGLDTGTANAYVINFTANFTSLTDGIVIYWIPANTNSLSSTLNVNGLGAAPLVNFDGSALISNQVIAGQITQVMYLSGSWRLLNSLPVSGTFTGSMIGLTATVTGTCRYALTGRIVAVRLPALSGTSNSTACTVTGVPTFLTPTAASQVFAVPDSSFLDNSIVVSDIRAFTSPAFPGTITFQKAGSSTGFNSGGAKGLNNEVVLMWSIA